LYSGFSTHNASSALVILANLSLPNPLNTY
jgi:hypothetical protein